MIEASFLRIFITEDIKGLKTGLGLIKLAITFKIEGQ
jgi:hypothetical protein